MVDLHIHSTFSDGTFTPTQLAKRARENNLKVMSITDHDNIDGLIQGRKAAEKLGITFIDGIEISANFNGKDVHILGYFLDLKDSSFLKWLKILQEKRFNRILKTLKKLEKLGIELDIEEVKSEASGGILGRPHIANLMVKKGYVYSLDAAFDKYLADGKPCYVPKVGVGVVEVLKVLKSNRAIVSLAHPHLINYPYDTVVNIIDLLVNNGLDGIELHYPFIDIRKKQRLMKISKKRNLVITGGSDFHGTNRNKVDINMGKIPIDIYEELREKKNK